MAEASAVACSNIALVKYWGKSERGDNLTAVPSLSLTLDALRTTTRVRFDGALLQDRVILDGVRQDGRAHARVVRVLDALRKLAGVSLRAEVRTQNDFPTASGLASSASGFAALALAADGALGLGLSRAEVSAVARRASASAARSLFGGFVELGREADHAAPVAASDELDLRMVIAATTLSPKPVGSTEGMLHTAATSPYYPIWIRESQDCFEAGKQALLTGDFQGLGLAMERSTWLMHASMLAARPALFYWNAATWRVIERVHALRQSGVAAFYTMDAGPHVKILVRRAEFATVRDGIAGVPGVERVIASGPGPGAWLL